MLFDLKIATQYGTLQPMSIKTAFLVLSIFGAIFSTIGFSNSMNPMKEGEIVFVIGALMLILGLAGFSVFDD